MMARHFKGTKQILTVSLNAELIAKVEELADAKNVSRSRMVEQLIERALTQEQVEVAVFANPLLRDAVFNAVTSPQFMKGMESVLGDKKPSVDPAEFHRGIQLLSNYGDEYAKGLAPEHAAKATMKKTIAQNKRRAKKKGKG